MISETSRGFSRCARDQFDVTPRWGVGRQACARPVGRRSSCHKIWATALMPTLFLGGCASYAPEPLSENPALLSASLASAISSNPTDLGRPPLPAASIDLSRPLDGTAIGTLAVLGNADLRAQRTRAGISEAQLFAARLLPDPTFSIGVSKVLTGPDPFLDIAGALGFDLNQLRTRGVRLAQAGAHVRQVRLDLVWAEWQTAGQAEIQAIRIGSLESQYALAAASREMANRLFETSLRAASRGDLAPNQLEAARIAAFDAAERARTMERDLAAARLELTKILGLPPQIRLVLAPTKPPATIPPADTLFAIARVHRADLAALRAGYGAQEASVHKAILDQFPTLGLTVNGNRDSAGNLKFGPAVDLTLPLWNRNRGTIAVERATRSALKAEFEARLFQTRAEIAAAVSGFAVARQQHDAALHDIPALEKIAAASRRAAERGDLAIATAEAAEQALRDKELIAAQAGQALGEQAIALELLTGMPRTDWPK